MKMACSSGLFAVLWCFACGGSSSTANENVVVVVVSPTSGTLQTGQTQQFTATVNGTKDTAVAWSVTAGSISTGGLYAAPSSIPGSSHQATVTATSQADSRDSAAAILTITAGPSSPSVIVTPSAATVNVFGNQQFSAATRNLQGSAVVWQVDGVTGGTQSSGYISSLGLYNAPVS